MYARVFYSKNPVLELAIEETIIRYKNHSRSWDKKGFDFVVAAYDPNIYPYDSHVIEVFDNYFGKNRWLAFHSVASFANAKTVESGFVALFLKFTSKGKVHVRTFNGLNSNYTSLVKETANYLTKHREDLNVAITTFSGGLPGFFIESLQNRLDFFPNLIGGVASGIETQRRIIDFIYTSEGIVEDGFAIISFTNVKHAFGVAFGHSLVGPIYQITDAKRNYIKEIEGRPAVELLKVLFKGLEDKLPELFWYTPIVILDETTEDIALLRSYQKEEGGYLYFYGPIKKGWRFRFAFAHKDRLLEADLKEALNIRRKLNNVELAFNFSCLHRQYLLENKYREEAKIYSSILNAPLFGFFTLGEIGPDKRGHKLRYYNETSLVVGLKEV